MALLRKLTILQRLILMLVLAAIGTLCFASFSIKEQYDNLITQKWLQNDAQLNTALSVVAAHRTQAQAGKLTLEEAQQESAALIGQMRYGREGYFILLSDQARSSPTAPSLRWWVKPLPVIASKTAAIRWPNYNNKPRPMHRQTQL